MLSLNSKISLFWLGVRRIIWEFNEVMNQWFSMINLKLFNNDLVNSVIIGVGLHTHVHEQYYTVHIVQSQVSYLKVIYIHSTMEIELNQ